MFLMSRKPKGFHGSHQIGRTASVHGQSIAFDVCMHRCMFGIATEWLGFLFKLPLLLSVPSGLADHSCSNPGNSKTIAVTYFNEVSTHLLQAFECRIHPNDLFVELVCFHPSCHSHMSLGQT